MNRVRSKLHRGAHDGWAAICSASGKKALPCRTHSKVVRQTPLIPSSNTSTSNALESAFFDENSNHSIAQPEVSLYQIENVYVVGAQGHLFVDKHHYLNRCPSFDGIADKKIRRPIPWLAKTIEEPVFVLMGRGLGNRGHFLVEHLPRLLACQDLLPKETKIMVPPGQKKWAEQYLEKLGVASERVMEGAHGTILLKQAFYMPLFSGDDKARLAPKPFYEALRDAFIPPSSCATKRQLFITRNDAPSRMMLNEEAIFDRARSQFPALEKVSMPALSLDEQVEMFACAEVVMGPHNQAFRNALFCSEALCIQLVNGDRNEENEYYFWANNYSQLGDLFGNACIALYSETPLDAQGNWSYPEDKFSKDLDRAVSCWKS